MSGSKTSYLVHSDGLNNVKSEKDLVKNKSCFVGKGTATVNDVPGKFGPGLQAGILLNDIFIISLTIRILG